MGQDQQEAEEGKEEQDKEGPWYRQGQGRHRQEVTRPLILILTISTCHVSSVSCVLLGSHRTCSHFLAHSAYFNNFRQKISYFDASRQKRVLFNCFATKQCLGMLKM